MGQNRIPRPNFYFFYWAQKLREKKNAGCGVRTHAHLCAEDLKSSPLTSRANQLVVKQTANNYYILFTIPEMHTIFVLKVENNSNVYVKYKNSYKPILIIYF